MSQSEGLGTLLGVGGLGGVDGVVITNSGSFSSALRNNSEAFFNSLSPRRSLKGHKETTVASRKQRGGRTLVATKAQPQRRPLRGKILLDVKAARNLAKADIIGKSDPYAICQTTTGAPRFKTKTIKNTLDPEWNESTTFQVFFDGELIVTVWDWDRIGKDDFLGVLTIPFEEIVAGMWREGLWSKFTRETSEKSKKKLPGEIFLRIQWEPELPGDASASCESERIAHPLTLSIPKTSKRDLRMTSPREGTDAKPSTHLDDNVGAGKPSTSTVPFKAQSAPAIANTHTREEKKSSPLKTATVMKPNLGLGLKINLATVPPKGIMAEEVPAVDANQDSVLKAASHSSLVSQVTSRLCDDSEIGAKYEFKETLGEGAFAVVKRAISRATQEEMAVKIANKEGHWTENTAKRFKQEIEIIYGLHHPYVVSVKDIAETLQNVYIVMELVTGGDLFHAIVKVDVLPEAAAAKALREILLGLQYVHENGIVHRDMKCENVLLTAGGRCKLADFGVSCYIKQGEVLSEWAGTMLYMAPEQLNGKGYGQAVDLWATGIIAYNALSGTHPFDGGNNATLLQSVSESKLDFPSEDWEGVSKDARDFVAHLIEPDPDKRYTAAKALDHPWITKHSKRARRAAKKKGHWREYSAPVVTPAPDAGVEAAAPLSSSVLTLRSEPHTVSEDTESQESQPPLRKGEGDHSKNSQSRI